MTSLGTARLAALAQESRPRYRKALERAVERRATLQSRYLALRVICIGTAAGGFALWLSSLSINFTRYAALAVGAMLVLSIVIESCSEIGRRTADWVMPVFALILIPLDTMVAPLAFLTSGFAKLV